MIDFTMYNPGTVRYKSALNERALDLAILSLTCGPESEHTTENVLDAAVKFKKFIEGGE